MRKRLKNSDAFVVYHHAELGRLDSNSVTSPPFRPIQHFVTLVRQDTQPQRELLWGDIIIVASFLRGKSEIPSLPDPQEQRRGLTLIGESSLCLIIYLYF